MSTLNDTKCMYNWSKDSYSEPICDMPVAMAYVPWQHYSQTYELCKALQVGTIFPELNKPFCGKRGIRK